jgi:hypothetical protein
MFDLVRQADSSQKKIAFFYFVPIVSVGSLFCIN